LDTRVCWDGQTEQLSPGGANAPCDASGMQTVYMLTAFAVNNTGAVGPNAAHKLLQIEVVAPSIRPAGVLTAASVNINTSGMSVMPALVIDGHAHDINGVPIPKPLPLPGVSSPSNSCTDIAALATDTGGAQLASALDAMRRNLVNAANASCGSDGSGLNGNVCSPGLWWVRGTDPSPQFVTTVSTSGSNSGSSDGGSSGGSGNDGGGDHHGSSTTACNSTTPNCYTYLNLAAPQLFGTFTTGQHVPTALPIVGPAPFMGGSGNQTDSTIYQPGVTQTVADQVAAVRNFFTANANQQSYLTVSSGTLNSTYGSVDGPVIVNFTDPTLSLQSGASLTGYGLLVINGSNGSLEINSGATFNWTGIVLINSPSGHVTVFPGAQGRINGALLLTPGAVFNTQTMPPTPGGGPPLFGISYSCEAIDKVFSMQPFKVISTAETSF
jgi:hypothetical protein